MRTGHLTMETMVLFLLDLHGIMLEATGDAYFVSQKCQMINCGIWGMHCFIHGTADRKAHKFIWLLSANHRCVLWPFDQWKCSHFVTLNLTAFLFTFPWFSSMSWFCILNSAKVSMIHRNHIGKNILFQIDKTTFICIQRTN